MPTAYQLLTHSGNAPEATLAVPMSAVDLSFTLAPAGVGAGYPTGPAWIEIDPDSTANEKILYVDRVGDTFTIASLDDRGGDGTTAQSHTATAKVRHIFAAVEAGEANDVAHQVLGGIVAKGDLPYGAGANQLGWIRKGAAGQYPAWQADGSIAPASPAVVSVAGKTGAVTLTTADVPGALDSRAITKASLAGYTEQLSVNPGAGASITYDATARNVYDTTLTANLAVDLVAAGSGVSELSLIHRQDATGGRIVTWPAGSVKWPGGVAPTPDTSPNAVNVWSLFTTDGATWYGFLAGRGMA